MTIKEALNVQHRTVSARDAEVLLAAALDCDRTYLHTHPAISLSSEQEEVYEAYLRRRENNEPVAYITGRKEFFGRPFKADKRALIPRPETEGAVEHTLAFVTRYFKESLALTGKPCPVRILELGTGGGPIAVTLGLELALLHIPATIIATDVAPEALTLAEENWNVLQEGTDTSVIKMSFIEADLFEHEKISERAFDCIVANLPYVETTWKVETGAQPDVVFHEPDVALFGGEDGLEIYRRFFKEAPSHLTENGAVIIEYGDTQTALIIPLAESAFPHKKVTVYQDYANLDRTLVIK